MLHFIWLFWTPVRIPSVDPDPNPSSFDRLQQYYQTIVMIWLVATWHRCGLPCKRNAELTKSFISFYLSQWFFNQYWKMCSWLIFFHKSFRDLHEGLLSSRTNLHLYLNPTQSGYASETLMSYGLLVIVFLILCLKKGAVERVEEQCKPLNGLTYGQVIFALNQTLQQHEDIR